MILPPPTTCRTDVSSEEADVDVSTGADEMSTPAMPPDAYAD